MAAAPWDAVQEEQAVAKEALALERAKLKEQKELDGDSASSSDDGHFSERSSE